jgi:hypothetical protein
MRPGIVGNILLCPLLFLAFSQTAQCHDLYIYPLGLGLQSVTTPLIRYDFDATKGIVASYNSFSNHLERSEKGTLDSVATTSVEFLFKDVLDEGIMLTAGLGYIQREITSYNSRQSIEDVGLRPSCKPFENDEECTVKFGSFGLAFSLGKYWESKVGFVHGLNLAYAFLPLDEEKHFDYLEKEELDANPYFTLNYRIGWRFSFK